MVNAETKNEDGLFEGFVYVGGNDPAQTGDNFTPQMVPIDETPVTTSMAPDDHDHAPADLDIDTTNTNNDSNEANMPDFNNRQSINLDSIISSDKVIANFKMKKPVAATAPTAPTTKTKTVKFAIGTSTKKTGGNFNISNINFAGKETITTNRQRSQSTGYGLTTIAERRKRRKFKNSNGVGGNTGVFGKYVQRLSFTNELTRSNTINDDTPLPLVEIVRYFDFAVSEIYSLLRRDSFNRFLETKQYKKFYKQCASGILNQRRKLENRENSKSKIKNKSKNEKKNDRPDSPSANRRLSYYAATDGLPFDESKDNFMHEDPASQTIENEMMKNSKKKSILKRSITPKGLLKRQLSKGKSKSNKSGNLFVKKEEVNDNSQPNSRRGSIG